MLERRGLSLLAREPLYNTRAVVQRTQVPADTFRAWERRYSLPQPYRTSGNQRLYSERDIGVIAWLRDRTVEGMTISQAIQRLRSELPGINNAPLPQPLSLDAEVRAEVAQESSILQLRRRMVEAIIDFDDAAGDLALDEAFGLFSIEKACTWVIEAVLMDIGELWERGELTVTAEHFATRLIVRRLYMLLTMIAPPSSRTLVISACPPGEQHEVGLLILSIFLARRNVRVVYLGADVPAPDLVTTVSRMLPDLVCLGASSHATAVGAVDLSVDIAALDPAPHVVLGGRGFFSHSAESANMVDGLTSGTTITRGTALAATEHIMTLLDRHGGRSDIRRQRESLSRDSVGTHRRD